MCVGKNAKIVLGKRIKLSFFCHSKDDGMKWVCSCAARATSADSRQSETKAYALLHRPRTQRAQAAEPTDRTGKGSKNAFEIKAKVKSTKCWLSFGSFVLLDFLHSMTFALHISGRTKHFEAGAENFCYEFVNLLSELSAKNAHSNQKVTPHNWKVFTKTKSNKNFKMQ